MSAHRRLPLIVCDAVIDRHRRLTLVAADAVVAAAAATGDQARTLRGLALPYAADGRTSAGRVRASAGRVTWATDLRRIKVFTGHDRTRPVGYVTTLTETATGLQAELHIAETPDGNAALLEAREGTRDALSVELEDVELDDNGDLVAAELVAIALVPLPAFSDARIAAELGDPDPDPNPLPVPPLPAPAPARAPAALHRRPAQPLTFDAAVAEVSAAFAAGNRSGAALTAALANITPVSTNSAVAAPPQWLGEIWTPELVRLNWVQAAQTATLTGPSLVGWKRIPPGPVISPYTGNKAPIPTDGTLAFGPVNVAAHRHAVGADFDRIYLDLGDDASVISTWLRLVSQDYAKKLDEAIGTLVLTEATDGGTAGDAIGAIKKAAKTLRDVGASVSWIALAADVMAEYLDIPTASAPWWLTGSSSVDLSGESATVNNLRVFESAALPLGTVTAGDRRAVTQYTPRGNPFTVRAIDMANGGIDAGVFGYSAELVNDPLGIVTVSVVTVP